MNQKENDLKKIVINGCNGSCCEKFTFKYSQEQLAQLISDHENGISLRDDIDQVKKILEMLVPLGQTEVCPQERDLFNNLYIKNGWKEEQLIQENVQNFIVENGVLKSNIFTCKYFDKDKRICTNYENRPDMCKRFGITCRYEGCCFVKNMSNQELVKLEVL